MAEQTRYTRKVPAGGTEDIRIDPYETPIRKESNLGEWFALASVRSIWNKEDGSTEVFETELGVSFIPHNASDSKSKEGRAYRAILKEKLPLIAELLS